MGLPLFAGLRRVYVCASSDLVCDMDKELRMQGRTAVKDDPEIEISAHMC
jgi:hypothetical protein